MADFAIWATACETAFWSTGTFARCYKTNRRASIDDVVDADPVAACVREIMATRSSWKRPANVSVFAKSSPGPTLRKPTARPSASSKLRFANGLTLGLSELGSTIGRVAQLASSLQLASATW